MNYREIVAEAWQFTQENKKLAIWYGAFPSFFTTLVGIVYFTYQYYAFLSSKLFQHWNKSFLTLVFTTGLDYLQHNRAMIIPLVITGLIVAVGYFLVPVVCQGALIQMIARRKNGQKIPGRKGLSYGFMSFLPLFEYRLFVQTFSIISILSTMGTTIRNLGWTVLPILVPIFVLVVIAALLIAICFTYTEFYIVIDDDGVFSSIAKSVRLVVQHLEETILLTILMLLIGLRIIIQILFVLLIPIVAIGVVYLLASANLPNLGIALGSLLGISGLLIASYLNGIIHTFAMSVWTFTFLKLTSEVKPHARDRAEEQANINESNQE